MSSKCLLESCFWRKCLGSTWKCLVSSWKCLESSWKCLVSSWKCLVFNWKCLVLLSKVSSWKCLVSSWKCLVSSLERLVSAWKCLVYTWKFLVSIWKCLVSSQKVSSVYPIFTRQLPVWLTALLVGWGHLWSERFGDLWSLAWRATGSKLQVLCANDELPAGKSKGIGENNKLLVQSL